MATACAEESRSSTSRTGTVSSRRNQLHAVTYMGSAFSVGGAYGFAIDNMERLTFNAWEWDKHPSWSPDGSQIVFYSNRDTGRRQLWIMAADGAGQRNLSSNEYNDWDPVWVR